LLGLLLSPLLGLLGLVGSSSSNSSHFISWIIGVSALKSVLDRETGRLVHESCHS
jgi:hypothetical protein